MSLLNNLPAVTPEVARFLTEVEKNTGVNLLRSLERTTQSASPSLTREEEVFLRANRNAEAHKSLLYLAGPITGCTYGACTDWRFDFAAALPDFILPISPMRAKGYLKDCGVLEGSYNEFALSTERGINKRDKTDVRRSDMVFVNFIGATRVSIGTVMEIAWAQEYQKPIVVAMEPKGNPHDGHPMLNDSIDFRVDNLDDALYIVTHILRTGV